MLLLYYVALVALRLVELTLVVLVTFTDDRVVVELSPRFFVTLETTHEKVTF